MYGDAWYWPDAAMAQGLPNGGEPKVGSVVTFQPFIQSAGPVGHVAVVLAVNLDGSYLMTEMNATCGWDCVDQRTSLPGRGVRFLY